MIKSIREIIEDVLLRLEDAGIPKSDEAVDLIFETGMTETGYKHLEQMGNGPAVSFFQLEPNTIKDIWDNYVIYRKPLIEGLYKLGYIEEYPSFSVMTNIAVAIAFCRIHYRRQPGPIPKIEEERAKYWKEYYNTRLGKGTVHHYLEQNGYS